jgi:hypothetical protein
MPSHLSQPAARIGEPPRRALRLFTRSNHRPACASPLSGMLTAGAGAAYREPFRHRSMHTPCQREPGNRHRLINDIWLAIRCEESPGDRTWAPCRRLAMQGDVATGGALASAVRQPIQGCCSHTPGRPLRTMLGQGRGPGFPECLASSSGPGDPRLSGRPAPGAY